MMCQICNETRGIQKCHIVSRKLDNILKEAKKFNTLELYPNHHWAFDHNLLTEAEYNKIQGRIRTMLHIFNERMELWGKIGKLEDKVINELIKENYKHVLWNKTIKNRIFGDKEIEKCLPEGKNNS